MKKKIIIVIVIIVVLIASFLIGTGLMKNPNVVLGSYSVSQDGSVITLNAGVATSMGYVRGYKDNGGGVKPHYLTFYSTFGGLNSSFGAKNTFTLEIAPEDTEIYFNRADGGYELVLVKDEDTGDWIRPTDLNSQQNQTANEESEKWDMIPMVMVDGKLYLATGYESTVEARCGVMDGEITSEVDGNEKPTKNNQSNFGTGFGYQYGSQEGTIEIYMNEKWWIFATEEVRQQILSEIN